MGFLGCSPSCRWHEGVGAWYVAWWARNPPSLFTWKKWAKQTRLSLKSSKPFVGFQEMLKLDIWYLILPNSWVYTWNILESSRYVQNVWTFFVYVSCELKGTTFYFHTISERSRYIFQLWRISLCSGGFLAEFWRGVILVVEMGGQSILGEAEALRMVTPLRLQFPDLPGESDFEGSQIPIPDWWFQIFFIFTPIWGRFPFWLIFFKGVETTN